MHALLRVAPVLDDDSTLAPRESQCSLGDDAIKENVEFRNMLTRSADSASLPFFEVFLAGRNRMSGNSSRVVGKQEVILRGRYEPTTGGQSQDCSRTSALDLSENPYPRFIDCTAGNSSIYADGLSGRELLVFRSRRI